MGHYRLTRRAAADLYSIFIFGRRQFGLVQAKAYADRLDHVFGLLAEQPLMGRPAPAIGEAVHRHEHGSHIVLYRPSDEFITILAVVHRRSVKRLRLCTYS